MYDNKIQIYDNKIYMYEWQQEKSWLRAAK